MSSIRRLLSVPVAAAALVAASCKESSTAPTVDPTVMATSVDGINNTFAQNAVFQSLATLAGRFTLTAPAALPSPAPAGAWGSAATQLLRMRSLASRAPGAALALFPVNILGKTFQWDTASGGRYRIMDSTLAGAASLGIRFILYQVDTATGKPRLPLQTTGNVDLIDQSTQLADVLHVLLHVGTQSAADYTISEVKTTTTLTLSATGYVVDVVAGGTPASFTLTHLLTLSDSSLTTDYSLTGSGATVTMHTGITGSGGGSVTLDWLVQKNGSLEVVGSSTPATINVAFKFNGTTWATVIGDPNAPTFSGANGRQLTPSELLAMGQILEGFAGIAGNLNGVFGPGFLVFK